MAWVAFNIVHAGRWVIYVPLFPWLIVTDAPTSMDNLHVRIAESGVVNNLTKDNYEQSDIRDF